MDGRPAPRLIGVALLALLTACGAEQGDETVSLYGTMYVGPEVGEPPEVLSGAHLDGYDDLGELVAEGEEPWPEDSPAYYRIRGLPPESHVNAVAWSEDGDHVPTVHAAWMPPANLYTYDGELFILSHAWMEYRLKLANKVGHAMSMGEAVAPDVADSGGFALGWLAEPEDHEGTRLFVAPPGAKPVEAVYLDGFGIARPELIGTGPDGTFAIFGVPAGPAQVQMFEADDTFLGSFPVLMIEDACTSLFDLELVP